MLLHGDHVIQSNDCNCITLSCSCLITLQGLPVFAIGVGLSTFDKASVSIMIKFLIYVSLVPVLMWNYNFYCLVLIMYFYLCSFFILQVHYYVQSHIQINEYRDRVILVSMKVWNLLEISSVIAFRINFFLSHCVDSYINCLCSLLHLKNMGGLLPLV